jgi:hypothetical protein
VSVFTIDDRAFEDWLRSGPDYAYVVDSLRKGVEDFFADFINNGKYSRLEYTDPQGATRVIRDEAQRLYDATRHALHDAAPQDLPKVADCVEKAVRLLERTSDRNRHLSDLPSQLRSMKERLQTLATHFSEQSQVHAMSHEDNLGPEYKYDVRLSGPELALLSTLHSGMDPIYALTSRLYAYGQTKASERELDDVIDALDGVVNDIYPDTSQDDKALARGIINKFSRLIGLDEHVAFSVSGAGPESYEIYRRRIQAVFNDLYDSLFGQYASYTVEDPGQLESAMTSARKRIREVGERPTQGNLERLQDDANLLFGEFRKALSNAGISMEARQAGYKEVVDRSIEAMRRILAAGATTPEDAPLRKPNRPPYDDMGPISGSTNTRSGKGETTMALPPKIEYKGRKYVLAENPARPEKSAVDEGKSRKELEDQFPGRSPVGEQKYLEEVKPPSGKSDAVTDTPEMNKKREEAMKGKDSRSQDDLNSNAPNKIKYAGLEYVRADTILPPRIKYAGHEYVRLGYGDAGEYTDAWKPGDEKGVGKKMQDYFNMSDSKEDVSEHMVNRDVDFSKAEEGIDPASSEPGPEKGKGDGMPNDYMDKEEIPGMPRHEGDDERTPKAASAQPPKIRHAGHLYVKVSDEEARQIIAAKKKGRGRKSSKLPKGWDLEDAESAWKKMGGKKGSHAMCVRKIEKGNKDAEKHNDGKKKKDHKGIVKNPEALCTWLEKEAEKGKKKEEKGKKGKGGKKSKK